MTRDALQAPAYIKVYVAFLWPAGGHFGEFPSIVLVYSPGFTSQGFTTYVFVLAQKFWFGECNHDSQKYVASFAF